MLSDKKRNSVYKKGFKIRFYTFILYYALILLNFNTRNYI